MRVDEKSHELMYVDVMADGTPPETGEDRVNGRQVYIALADSVLTEINKEASLAMASKARFYGHLLELGLAAYQEKRPTS